MKIIAIAESRERMRPRVQLPVRLGVSAPLRKNFCINRRIKENFAMAGAQSPAREGACVLQK
jgi:hypothetical protein